MARSLNRHPASPPRPSDEIVEANPAGEPAATRTAPRKKRAATIPAFPADNDAMPDFAAELEAALMSDLQTVDSVWSDEAEQRADETPFLAEPFDLGQADADFRDDRLAFETLIRRGPDRAPQQDRPSSDRPRQDRPRQDRPSLDGPRTEMARTAAASPRTPGAKSPRAKAPRAKAPTREALRPETSSPRIERRPTAPLRAQALPQREQESGGRWVEPGPDDDEPPAMPGVGISRLNRGLIAIAAVTVLVGAGAFVTLQSVKARTEQPVGAATQPATLGDAAPLAAAQPPANSVSVKESYDRAPADESLPEAPQLRGDDLTSVSPLPKSPAMPAPVVDPVAALSVPAPIAVDAAPPSTVPPPSPSPIAETSPPPTPSVVAALTPSTVKKPLASGAVGPATIVSAVKLRAGPANNAATVTLLKAGMTVNVVRCKGWCEIVANGQHGYVFQKFLASAKPIPAKAAGATPTGLF